MYFLGFIRSDLGEEDENIKWCGGDLSGVVAEDDSDPSGANTKQKEDNSVEPVNTQSGV